MWTVGAVERSKSIIMFSTWVWDSGVPIPSRTSESSGSAKLQIAVAVVELCNMSL